jgi:mRNA interferase MazF
MKVNEFEIWIADLNPHIGTEPGKGRPVLVIQTDLLNKVHPSTLICPMTTKVEPKSEILRVHLRKGQLGLSHDTDILIDQIRAIDNKRLIKRSGILTADLIEKVKENIKIILNFD